MIEPLWQKGIESVLAALAIAVCIVFSPLLRWWYNRWGATTDEVLQLLPGDERVRRPRLGYTRAITIRALPVQIWPWLVQMGQERGGLYSYEALENIIGCHMEPINFVMERKTLLGIRARAEGTLVERQESRWVKTPLGEDNTLIRKGMDDDT